MRGGRGGRRGETSASGSTAERPSRYELLNMIRKHSAFLTETTVDEEDGSDVQMDSGFWHDIMDLYFILGKESKGRQDDDLIFFVRSMKLHGFGFNDNMGEAPHFFVRRWAPKLEMVIEDSADVDWRHSFYLNLIAHTSYTVTVAICSLQVLQTRISGADTPLSSIYKVVKTVYASPSRVNLQLDSKKDSEPQPAYPNICFTVDDFDSTFDALVLTDPNHCYCVALSAHDGAAFPAEKELIERNSLKGDMGSKSVKPSGITVFSGFVSYKMVREAYDAGRSRWGSLLSVGHHSFKTEKLIMRGPGGHGEVEVAISGVLDQSLKDSGSPLPNYSLKKGFGIGLGGIARKAASVASMAAKHAYAATKIADEDLLPLRCCLMSISLSWELIAHDLLFKRTPPLRFSSPECKLGL